MNKENCYAAFVQADITPDFMVELIGGSVADNQTDAVSHPLLGQLLMLQHGQVRYCLAAIDSLGLTTALGARLREAIAMAAATTPEYVMLNFSHTHSAPAPLSPVNGARYYQLLEMRMAACAREAAGKLVPCQAAWDAATLHIGENRREGCTAVDDRLIGLQISAAESGTPIATLLRISAHANILMCSRMVSSDFFGIARQKLDAAFGHPTMLWQGAAGNLKPIGVDKLSGGTVEDAERTADILLQDVQALHFDARPVECLAMAEVPITYTSDVPGEAQAAQIARDAESAFGINGQAWLQACAQLRAEGIATQQQAAHIHMFALNEGCLCGVADEIFCEIALEAATQAGSPLFALGGYTDACTGYLPHAAEWIKGGYETLYSYLTFYQFHGHVMPFRQESAGMVINKAIGWWEKYKDACKST